MPEPGQRAQIFHAIFLDSMSSLIIIQLEYIHFECASSTDRLFGVFQETSVSSSHPSIESGTYQYNSNVSN